MRWHTWPFPTSARCQSTATIVVPVGHVGDVTPSLTCTPSHTSHPLTNSTQHANVMIVTAPMEGAPPRATVNSEMQLFLLLPLSPVFERRLCS
jgi:hypothetical protein